MIFVSSGRLKVFLEDDSTQLIKPYEYISKGDSEFANWPVNARVFGDQSDFCEMFTCSFKVVSRLLEMEREKFRNSVMRLVDQILLLRDFYDLTKETALDLCEEIKIFEEETLRLNDRILWVIEGQARDPSSESRVFTPNMLIESDSTSKLTLTTEKFFWAVSLNTSKLQKRQN